MTENQPTPADRHDLPDDTRGPDTPTKLDDPGTMMARNQPPRDEPAEGRRDIADGPTQPQDER
jgi:hypothetical protein